MLLDHEHVPLNQLLFIFVLVVQLLFVTDSLWSHGLKPTRFLCPGGSPGKNTGVGCHFLLQGIVSDQGSNPRLLHCQGDSLPVSQQGSPSIYITCHKYSQLYCEISTNSIYKQNPDGTRELSKHVWTVIYSESSHSFTKGKLVTRSCLTFCDPMDCTLLSSSVHGNLQAKEYWSGLPIPSPGDLPNPGIKRRSPALQADSLPTEPAGKPSFTKLRYKKEN